MRHTINNTWLESEEYAYTPRGSRIRRCKAICEDGKTRIVRCGISDTYFIPARVTISGKYTRGSVTSGDSGYEFIAYDKDFIDGLEKRHMSDWTEAEMIRYNRLTNQ